MYNKILEKIKQYDTVIIHRHSNPDGDALGSQIGLRLLLEENFPEKKIYTVGDAPKRYAFMAGSTMDEIDDGTYEGALAIILDTSAKALISDDRFALAAETIRIDHHIFCEKIADLELTDTSFESCAGLVADFAKSTGLRMTPEAAKSLYTGMITDSGRFRYDSTTSKTFLTAAYLCEQKFDTNEIYRNLYASDFQQMVLKARFTLKIQFTQHNVAYIYTDLAEMQELNTDTFSISRGMVATMSDIKGVDIWVNFTETENGVLCELRSNRYNINPIAVKYGGGGHAKASGATVKTKEDAMAMLRDLDAMAQEAV